MLRTRIAPRGRTCLLPAVLALVIGCEGEDGGCSARCASCQKALDHMQGKIEQYGCNPGLMENARDRIVDDCDGESPYELIGAIVEECQSGIAPTVECEHRYPVHMAFDFFIDPTSADDLYPDGVRFTVTTYEDAPPPEDGVFVVGVGETHRWERDVFSGSTLYVQLTDVDDPEGELAFAEEQIFVRETDEAWANYQFRTAVAAQSEDGLPIVQMLNF